MILERGFLSTLYSKEDSGRGKREESKKQGLQGGRRWNQSTGGTTLNCCLTNESDPYLNQPLLALGPCLTGLTLTVYSC